MFKKQRSKELWCHDIKHSHILKLTVIVAWRNRKASKMRVINETFRVNFLRRTSTHAGRPTDDEQDVKALLCPLRYRRHRHNLVFSQRT